VRKPILEAISPRKLPLEILAERKTIILDEPIVKKLGIKPLLRR